MLGIFASLAVLIGIGGCARPQSARWTMINVVGASKQADCHLLELPGGVRVMIDVAEGHDAGGAALAYLKAQKIKHLDLVVLSHFHWDHYGKFLDIIKAGITVDRVAINLPGSREIADVEKPWGCNWEDVQSVLRFLADRRIPYFTPRIGERLIEIKRGNVLTALDVVCLYDGVNTPVGKTDMNDTSIILRLTHGTTRALFTGDLNARLGAWLATSDFDLKADVLKVPHHGTEGLAPNEFFAKVDPKVALVTSPKELWFSLRSKRTRDFLAERKVPAYVSGICGTVKVEMDALGYRVIPENPLP
ncbi:MAG: MBL fold metallo-hydrolase [Verrucomicrobia bacterium]|nr:MBL fold metallo-hydrolase [Verrucomicrobiota bacterium]